MNTRRAFFLSLAGLAAVAPLAQAGTLSEVLKAGRPKLIKGHPDLVDFGHGLVVPMDAEVFKVLWEGDDRWLTYGHAFGSGQAEAMGKAEEAAIGTMKLMLLTLAFAPDRLERFDTCGWRLKSQNVADLIRGDIDLPGRPVMPTTDQVNDYQGSLTGDDNNPGQESTHAVTGWIIWKRDVTLDYVRKNAQLLPPGL